MRLPVLVSTLALLLGLCVDPSATAQPAASTTGNGASDATASERISLGSRPNFRTLLQALSEKYQVPIVWENPTFPVKLTTGVVDGTVAKVEAVATYSPILYAEMNLYPVELFRMLNLKKIVLCTGIAFNGQRRGGIPDFENNSLYMDVSFGRYDELYVRKSFHHELYHLIDWRDDYRLTDTEWSALNPEGFKYGKGGATLQGDAYAGSDRNDLPGFLNRYAQSGVEEDKAEIFSYSVADPGFVGKLSGTDAILRAKLAQMKKLMATYCPAVTESFWTESAKIDRRRLQAVSRQIYFNTIAALKSYIYF